MAGDEEKDRKIYETYYQALSSFVLDEEKDRKIYETYYSYSAVDTSSNGGESTDCVERAGAIFDEVYNDLESDTFQSDTSLITVELVDCRGVALSIW